MIYKYQPQSFHKKGNKITANKMTIRSRATSNKIVLALMVKMGLKAAFDNCINRISWGIISGKPNTAMMAAFCWALAAIAARKVKMRLRLQPPSKTRPIKAPAFTMGFPRNKLNKSKLSRLITSISKELNSNFDKTKLAGEAIE